MDRILPEAVSVGVAKAIEYVYSYGPLADKTVILGEYAYVLQWIGLHFMHPCFRRG